MEHVNKLRNLTLGVVLFFTSCATSMTPAQVNNSLPSLTKSKYVSPSEAEEAIKENECRYLVKGRRYIAPLGLNVNGDLKNGAKGIDEWVELDGGNAYVLISYNWVAIDHLGTTQLHVDFDTMICKH